MRVGATSARLAVSFAWYNSSDGLDSQENRGQASGAYIFRCAVLWGRYGAGQGKAGAGPGGGILRQGAARTPLPEAAV